MPKALFGLTSVALKAMATVFGESFSTDFVVDEGSHHVFEVASPALDPWFPATVEACCHYDAGNLYPIMGVAYYFAAASYNVWQPILGEGGIETWLNNDVAAAHNDGHLVDVADAVLEPQEFTQRPECCTTWSGCSTPSAFFFPLTGYSCLEDLGGAVVAPDTACLQRSSSPTPRADAFSDAWASELRQRLEELQALEAEPATTTLRPLQELQIEWEERQKSAGGGAPREAGNAWILSGGGKRGRNGRRRRRCPV